MNLFKLFTRRNKQTRQRITIEYDKKTGTITALRLNDKKGRTTTNITRRATLARLNSSNLAPEIRNMEKGGNANHWFRYNLAATTHMYIGNPGARVKAKNTHIVHCGNGRIDAYVTL